MSGPALPVVSSSGLPSEADGQTPWIGPGGQRMEWLELHLTYTCPERCVFCSEEHRMARYKPFPVTWGRIARVLRTHAKRGVKRLHLTGGEPTIHPKFVETLMLAKKLGMRTSVGTIGTMLSREEFARRALPFLDEALFSVHGARPEVHDPLARRDGSHERVTQAIRTCLRIDPSFRAFANTVLTKHNAEDLPETVAFLSELGVKLIVVSNTTPEGSALDGYEELAVPLEVLKQVLPRAAAAAGPAEIRFFGTPMCVLGEGNKMLSNDLHWDPRVTVEWADAPGRVVFDGFYNWAPDRKRVHVAACDGCTMKGVCMGVFDRYAELWSTDALEPFVGEAGS